MRIHHFYPRTKNIGDHFVQRGIDRMVRRIRPDATFELFNINSRGEDKIEFGLTMSAVERANREADLVIVGGSNLYEGSYRWSWGVHLEVAALKKLRVPLFLLGIGSGSNFVSPLHRPSPRATQQIRFLNQCATFSGARDVITFDWLQQLGVSKAKLMGDPATFIFNQPRQTNPSGHVLIAMPPRRFWTSKRQFLTVQARGRPMFKSLVALAQTLIAAGQTVVVVCNDPLDLPVAQLLFKDCLPGEVACPTTPEEYFRLLAESRAVVSGRLHTAVAAFSMGIPFLLMNVDQRTQGFIDTYQLERWSITPSVTGMNARVEEQTATLLSPETAQAAEVFIERRNHMYERAMGFLRALDV